MSARKRACIDAGRRRFVAAGAAMLAGCATAPATLAPTAPHEQRTAARDRITIDIHSHAGRVIASRPGAPPRAFVDVAAPMREGGMDVICLAIVTDTYVTRVTADGRGIEAFREPEPGELYALSNIAFARARAIIERDGLGVVVDAPSLFAAPSRGPSVIVASEAADFLEGDIDRVDEAFHQHALRHLQLTHYRVNELGDIQTRPPVHGGLTRFGADVIRRCNALGIVVDVAHGTLDLVKRAADVSSTPLVLSHTSLAQRPGARSRTISAEHARVVAATGGVIGVWPPSTIFHDVDALVAGMRALADVVGIEHVGLGSDMLGLLGPAVFASYRDLPKLEAAMARGGFGAHDIDAVLGNNYARVFAQSMRTASGGRSS